MLQALIHLIYYLKRFHCFENEVDKIDSKKLINVPTSINNLKTKVNDLDVDKLKTVTVDMKQLCDIVSKKVVKKTGCNKINTKVNIEKKIMYGTTLIHIDQCSTDKQNWRKKLEMLSKKYLMFLVW